MFWEHRELFPLAISYKILNFWISFGSPRTIPKVRDVSGGVNQIGRTNEVKMELADHDHKQNKDTEQGDDPLNAESKSASDV